MSTEDQSRSGFEAWVAKERGDLSTFGSGQNLHYRNSAVNNAWTGWQASRRTYSSRALELLRDLLEWAEDADATIRNEYGLKDWVEPELFARVRAALAVETKEG